MHLSSIADSLKQNDYDFKGADVYDMLLEPQESLQFLLDLPIDKDNLNKMIDNVFAIKNERILIHQLLGTLLSMSSVRVIDLISKKEIASGAILKDEKFIRDTLTASIDATKRFADDIKGFADFINGNITYNITRHAGEEIVVFLDNLSRQVSVYWYNGVTSNIVFNVMSEHIDAVFSVDINKLFEIIEVIVINAAQELVLAGVETKTIKAKL